MKIIKTLLRRILLPKGVYPYRIRGGALKGARFYLDLQVDTQVLRGVYEQALQSWLQEHVHKESVCFDVGAAEGWATLLMAKLAHNGTVYAFEPSSRGDWVQKNLQLNESSPLAKVVLSRSFVSNTKNSEEGHTTTTLDGYASENNLSRIDLIKIDVDGPEAEVLDGAMTVLTTFHPEICVEAHSHALFESVADRLRTLGYRIKVVEPPAHEYRPIGYNPMIFGSYSQS